MTTPTTTSRDVTVQIPSIHLPKSIATVTKQIAAVAAVVIGSLQSSGVMSGHYGYVLTLVGGVFMAVDHYVSNSN